MARNNQGLTGRQARFLNELSRGLATTDEVAQKFGHRPHTLRKWMREPVFVTAWEETNVLLQLRRDADAAILGRQGDDDDAAPPPNARDAAPARAKTSPDAPARAPEPPSKPRPTERDLIRARHGEEAARAFDELVRLRRAPEPVLIAPCDSPPPSGPPL